LHGRVPQLQPHPLILEKHALSASQTLDFNFPFNKLIFNLFTMPTIEESKVLRIGDVLNNADRPLKERFRALFTLKNIGGPAAIDCIRRCFADPSELLKHELAYCLGQMQDDLAIPILEDILRNKSEHPMVRHEAGKFNLHKPRRTEIM